MRRRLALLAVCYCTIAGRAFAHEASLTVLIKGQRLPAPILNAMEREARLAVESSGIHLDWRSQDEPFGEVTGGVAVVDMRGQCASAGPLPTAWRHPERRAEPLGQTHLVNGTVLPFADVLCDAVHRLVDHDLRAARPNEREELLGRALGRVLAHELFHILARTTDHTHQGISRAEQSSADLLAPGVSFVESDERRLAEPVGAEVGAGR